MTNKRYAVAPIVWFIGIVIIVEINARFIRSDAWAGVLGAAWSFALPIAVAIHSGELP